MPLSTLSLETSKKIYDAIGAYETDKCYIMPPSEKSGSALPVGWGVLGQDLEEYGYAGIPAPNFAELIRVFLKISMAKVWPESQNRLVFQDVVTLYASGPAGEDGMQRVDAYLNTLI